jgi:hypothetical protein
MESKEFTTTVEVSFKDFTSSSVFVSAVAVFVIFKYHISHFGIWKNTIYDWKMFLDCTVFFVYVAAINVLMTCCFIEFRKRCKAIDRMYNTKGR